MGSESKKMEWEMEVDFKSGMWEIKVESRCEKCKMGNGKGKVGMESGM